MTAERISPAIPVDDLASAVALWSTLLGCEPTFVDGSRWAQFDVGGSRLSLAGADRASDETAIMVKVTDLEASHRALMAAGHSPTEIEQGPHERRCTAHIDGTELVFYSAS